MRSEQRLEFNLHMQVQKRWQKYVASIFLVSANVIGSVIDDSFSIRKRNRERVEKEEEEEDDDDDDNDDNDEGESERVRE